jgi:hypothetical protein
VLAKGKKHVEKKTIIEINIRTITSLLQMGVEAANSKAIPLSETVYRIPIYKSYTRNTDYRSDWLYGSRYDIHTIHESKRNNKPGKLLSKKNQYLSGQGKRLSLRELTFSSHV